MWIWLMVGLQGIQTKWVERVPYGRQCLLCIAGFAVCAHRFFVVGVTMRKAGAAVTHWSNGSACLKRLFKEVLELFTDLVF